MNFNIQITFESGIEVNYVIPGHTFLDAILNFYKYAEDLQPIKSFTLLNN
jgi:hypothetical protein